jgi:hypothetical protein
MASNTIALAASVARASDDEILGLMPNAIRKTNRVVVTKNAGENTATTLPQADVDDFFAALESGEERLEVSDGLTNDGGEKAENIRSVGDAEKLNEVLNANPELRDAWHDAKAYREVFATPAEAQAATKLLGDLSRMDALVLFALPGRSCGVNSRCRAVGSAVVCVAGAGHNRVGECAGGQDQATESSVAKPPAVFEQSPGQADAAKVDQAPSPQLPVRSRDSVPRRPIFFRLRIQRRCTA